MNIGRNCPYLEINLQQMRNKIYLVLKENFDEPNDGFTSINKLSNNE